MTLGLNSAAAHAKGMKAKTFGSLLALAALLAAMGTGQAQGGRASVHSRFQGKPFAAAMAGFLSDTAAGRRLREADPLWRRLHDRLQNTGPFSVMEKEATLRFIQKRLPVGEPEAARRLQEWNELPSRSQIAFADQLIEAARQAKIEARITADRLNAKPKDSLNDWRDYLRALETIAPFDESLQETLEKAGETVRELQHFALKRKFQIFRFGENTGVEPEEIRLIAAAAFDRHPDAQANLAAIYEIDPRSTYLADRTNPGRPDSGLYWHKEVALNPASSDQVQAAAAFKVARSYDHGRQAAPGIVTVDPNKALARGYYLQAATVKGYEHAGLRAAEIRKSLTDRQYLTSELTAAQRSARSFVSEHVQPVPPTPFQRSYDRLHNLLREMAWLLPPLAGLISFFAGAASYGVGTPNKAITVVAAAIVVGAAAALLVAWLLRFLRLRLIAKVIQGGTA